MRRNVLATLVLFFFSAVVAAGQPEQPTQLPLLGKSAKRIPWAQAFEQKTPKFHVITNTTKELATEMAKALEQQYADFVQRFRLASEPQKPLPVKVFAEKAEFKKYSDQNGGRLSEHAVGYFDPNKKEIVMFWSDDPEDVLSTLYHETTHYFVDLYMKHVEAPQWMNEGLATYFETAQFKKSRLEIGQASYGHLLELQAAIKDNKHYRLGALLTLEDGANDAFGYLAYAQSWSLVYFFANYQGGKHGQRFGTYMEELRKGRKPEQAFKTAFLVTPEELEPIWKDYVTGMKIEGAKGWYERAQQLYYDAKPTEALEAVDKALAADAKHVKALNLRGVILYLGRKQVEALDALIEAAQADPSEPRTFYYLARTHEDLHRKGDKRGSAAEAEKAYLKAIELRPDYANALGLLAWLYASSNDPKLRKIKEAIPIAQRAVDLDPTSDVLDTLAECYFQDGQKEKAIETLKKALALEPKDEYLKDQLAKFMKGK